MKFKKIISLFLSILIITALTSCSNKSSSKNDNPMASQSIVDFNSKTIEGSKITNEIFKENDLTIINLWGTFCNPCIKEMPELEKIYTEFKNKKVNLLGVIIDEPLDKNQAKKIINDTKITYQSIIPDNNLKKQFSKYFDYVPVTLFVDSKGKVLKTFLPGATNFQNLKTTVEDILSKKLD